MIPIGVLASSGSPWAGLPAVTYGGVIGINATSDNKSSYSANPTLGDYEDGRVILISAMTNGTDANTTCTVGGVSATKIATVESTTDDHATHLWYYNGTLSGTQTVTVSISGGANYINMNVIKIISPYSDTPFAYDTALGQEAISTAVDLVPEGAFAFYQFARRNSSSVGVTYSGTTGSVVTIDSGDFNNSNDYRRRSYVIATSEGSGDYTTDSFTSPDGYAIMAVFR